MAASQGSHLGSFRNSDHFRAERVFALNSAGFGCPSVLGARSITDRSEVVLGYRRHWIIGFWLPNRGRLPPAGMAERSRSQTVFKLFLVNPDRTCDADDTVGWNF